MVVYLTQPREPEGSTQVLAHPALADEIRADHRRTVRRALEALTEGSPITAALTATWAGIQAHDAAPLGVEIANPFGGHPESPLAGPWAEGRAQGRATTIPTATPPERRPPSRAVGMTHAAHTHPED
jgi:hypothetical protein